MGSRIFDLTQVLNTQEIPDVIQIAEIMKTKT